MGEMMRAKSSRLALAVAAAVFFASAPIAEAVAQSVALKMSVPVKALSFGPVYLAVDSGAFAKRDIDMEVIVVRGGASSIAAVLGGNVQMTSVADDELMKVADTRKMIRVYSYANSFTPNLQVRNETLQKANITMSLPVLERVRRLKGATFGAVSLGGTTDMALRWLLQHSGLDPKEDVTVIRVGGLPALIASLKQGKIDGFMLSAPAGPIIENQGIGRIIVKHYEVPQFADEPFLGIDTLRDYLEQNGDIMKRVVDAVAEGQRMIHEDPKKAAKVLHEGSFKNVAVGLLEQSLTLMQEAFRPQKMSREQWDRLVKMRTDAGMEELANVKMVEGVHWTNELFVR